MKLFSFKKPVTVKNGNFIVEDLAHNHKYVPAFKYGKNYLMVSGENYQCFYDSKGNFMFIEYTLNQKSRIMLPGSPVREKTTTVKQFPEGMMAITKISDIIGSQKFQYQIIFEFMFPEKNCAITYTRHERHGNSTWLREGELPAIKEMIEILAANR
jgi:hypothetical protein